MKLATLTLVLGSALYAHHSVDQTYDLKTEVRLEGKIVQLLLRNPHSFLQVEAPGKDGNIERWSLEFPKGVNSLRKQGIEPGTLKAGDRVKIIINPSFKQDKRGNVIALRRESDGFEWSATVKRKQS